MDNSPLELSCNECLDVIQRDDSLLSSLVPNTEPARHPMERQIENWMGVIAALGPNNLEIIIELLQGSDVPIDVSPLVGCHLIEEVKQGFN